MRGIAAEARAWSVRAIAGASARPAREDVDPVKMLLSDSAMEQRVGGPGGRGPLLRRLERAVYGEPFMWRLLTRGGGRVHRQWRACEGVCCGSRRARGRERESERSRASIVVDIHPPQQ